MNEFQEIKKRMQSLFRGAMLVGGFGFLVILYQSGVFSSELKEAKQTTETETHSEIIFDGSIDEESGLILDKGYVEVNTHCGSCHSTKLVVQNRFNRDGWEKLIRWMQKEQNLWDLGDQEDVILSYLSRNYAPQTKGRRKSLEKIDWYVLNE